LTDPTAYLQQQIAALQAENQQLRAELERIVQQQETAARVRKELVIGGARLLVPLLDREKVVRSFGKLADTTSRFAGPPSGWPPREELLGDARVFMESCLRFTIRRRTILLFFSLLASAIPLIQLWLVVQQNEIIENQNKFAQIQVYDVVSRSMTEGDRNARLMTGALLSNADLEFLRGVIEEAFDPDLAGAYNAESVDAATRRLEDAAFRGYLMRAVVRGAENRAGGDADELYEQMQPMLHQILVDAGDRLPAILRLGDGEAKAIDGALAEQVDNYVAQLGGALRIYGRLARSTDETEIFHADVQVLLARLAKHPWTGRFGSATRFCIERFLWEVAAESELHDPPDALGDGDDPEQAVNDGLSTLRTAIGSEQMVDWDRLATRVKSP
jgi:hypothetical protein